MDDKDVLYPIEEVGKDISGPSIVKEKCEQMLMNMNDGIVTGTDGIRVEFSKIWVKTYTTSFKMWLP